MTLIGDWTAYIDVRPVAGDNNAANTLKIPEGTIDQFGTGTPIDPTANWSLIDFASGATPGPQVQFEHERHVISSNNGGDFTAGPAFTAFNGKVAGSGEYSMQAGAAYQMNLTGLNPSKRYTISLSANRNQVPASGVDERWGDWEILGAASSTQSSPTPAGTTIQVISPTEVRLQTENNTARGDMVTWSNIDPGADGAFSITAHVYLNNGSDRSYSPVLVRLQQTPAAVGSVDGDYDGNGTTDVAVFRPSEGRWYINGQSFVGWGLSTDIPVPGDYDGNGTTDVAVFRPSEGRWYINGQSFVGWGVSTDIPVPGDYDGNGTTDVAVFRPSEGRWYINGQSFVGWGLSTDIPVPGDYDGNGTTDVAVFRPSVRAPGISMVGRLSRWGNSTDIPVPGDYDLTPTTELRCLGLV